MPHANLAPACGWLGAFNSTARQKYRWKNDFIFRVLRGILRRGLERDTEQWCEPLILQKSINSQFKLAVPI
ncbi:hypothetical protein [Bradyrhizobium sp. USDA 3458]|uniref:hypothetical protein n=1 Tax=Bradyrhizobium sp. USDA 3458 TaxID=2591461 RepID=UPI001144C3E3|nr:hypothetical protein [Bradyrhizobium sp. USDA 3458]